MLSVEEQAGDGSARESCEEEGRGRLPDGYPARHHPMQAESVTSSSSSSSIPSPCSIPALIHTTVGLHSNNRRCLTFSLRLRAKATAH
eukprot:1140961-Rhodomonas_salina.1